MPYRPCRRRGTAYLMVLGIALIVTVLGVGSLMAARSYQRATSAATDWEEAGTLAFSATEQAMAALSAAAAASPGGWRAGYTSGASAFTAGLGRGTISWTLKDETDGNLSADYLRPFRLYGVGTVNAVTRVYSVQVRPAGSAMDVLRTSLHAAGGVTLSGTVMAGAAPLANVTLPAGGLGVISSNAAVALPPTLFGNVEAATVTGTCATRTGTNTTGAAAKALPGSANATFATYYSTPATPLGLATGGTMTINAALLSPGSNPYGATNPNGIYAVNIPGNSTLTISSSRILGTLIVTCGGVCTVNVSGPVCWQPAVANYPILIITGNKATVNITGSTTWLSEASLAKNLNPAGSPYNGVTNTTTTDDYPPVLAGIIYANNNKCVVQLSNNPYVYGTVLTEGTATVTGPCALVQNTATYANPPPGFSRGDAVALVPGTWRWDAVP